MTDQDRKYLTDILLTIGLIETFIADTKDFNVYLDDLKTQSAVERQLGILGEAVNKYDKLNKQHPLENARQIVGFRNRLIHTYDSIDQSIVWAIVKNHLEPLKSENLKRLD